MTRVSLTQKLAVIEAEVGGVGGPGLALWGKRRQEERGTEAKALRGDKRRGPLELEEWMSFEQKKR